MESVTAHQLVKTKIRQNGLEARAHSIDQLHLRKMAAIINGKVYAILKTIGKS